MVAEASQYLFNGSEDGIALSGDQNLIEFLLCPFHLILLFESTRSVPNRCPTLHRRLEFIQIGAVNLLWRYQALLSLQPFGLLAHLLWWHMYRHHTACDEVGQSKRVSGEVTH